MAANKPMSHCCRAAPRASSGFTMIEILVSLVIVVLGLLGLAGMQARIQQSEFESYQRGQALVLLYDMVDRINLNRATESCFALTNPAAGTPYYGVGSSALAACGASSSGNNTMADNSMAEWDGLLKGSAEVLAGASVGAMIGARGCVSYDASTEVPDTTGAPHPGTGIFTVAVAWQGMTDTFAPTVNCGNGLYGAETKRRVVFTTFRTANLN